MYVRAIFQVSNIILKSFRREVIFIHPSPAAKRTPKNPTQVKVNLKTIPNRYSPCFKHSLFVHKSVSWWPTSRINILTIYYKLGQGFITNCGSIVLLQIKASVITKWGRSYYKLEQPLLQIGTAITNWSKLYYKLGQLLQIAAIITNWGITIYDVYMWRLTLDHVTSTQNGFWFLIKVLMPSLVSFYQGLALIQVSTSFHMWKLRFHGACTYPLLTMYVCRVQSTRV